MGLKREVVAEYLTRSGKPGATVTRTTASDGRVTYSYIGAWGAGSGMDLATMRNIVFGWNLRAKRTGSSVAIAFTD